MYIIGKTGMRKTTLILNMALNDIYNNSGVRPRGDMMESLLNYIPSERINDVIYFNPADVEYPIALKHSNRDPKRNEEFHSEATVSIFTYSRYYLTPLESSYYMDLRIQNLMLDHIRIIHSLLGF